MIKRILIDILTEPDNKTFAYVPVLGLCAFLCVNIFYLIDTLETHTFEGAEYLKNMGEFLAFTGAAPLAQYGLHLFKKSNTEDKT